jgi:hypothetical protein
MAQQPDDSTQTLSASIDELDKIDATLQAHRSNEVLVGRVARIASLLKAARAAGDNNCACGGGARD